MPARDSLPIGRGRGGFAAALRQLRQPVLIGSLPQDALYVPAEQHELVAGLPDGELLKLDSAHGHDGFLIDAGRFEPALRAFVDRRLAPGARAPAPAPPAPPLAAGLRYAW